ncbi:MAG: chromophore lyase CpcT/CpeT [Phycisphaerales bacterium]
MLSPRVSLLIAVAACSLGGCHSPQAGPTNLTGVEPLESLAGVMVGSYSSAEQAKKDPDFRDIRLHMSRIWAARSDGPWLYVEQAAAGSLDKPYRQRVYRLALCEDPARGEGAIESRVFELPGDPLAFAGAWNDAKAFDGMRPEDLLPRDGCTVYLVATDESTWKGETDGESCASSLRGAAYATSQVTITANELRSWDRGFDKEGKQVWGAVKGPYQFRKQVESKPEAKSPPKPEAQSRTIAPPF